MTLVRSLFVAIALLVSTSAFAEDMQPENDRWQPSYDQQWVCFAHSTHGGQVYQGYPSYDQYQAEESAHQTCEYYEQHECDPHGCQIVYNGGHNHGHGHGNGY